MVKLEDRPRQRARYYRRKNNEISSFSKSFCATFLVILIITGAIYGRDFFRDLFLIAMGQKAPKLELQLPFSQKRQNILIMGVDVNHDSKDLFKRNRSDTILVVSIEPATKDVNILSIPRDSKVYIAGKDEPDKINHAFAYGGIRCSVRTIEESFGIKINHYLVVSNKALVDFIDAIGGLEIDVEKDMHYNDYSGKLHVNLNKGLQTLSGKQVEGYVRFRKDALGDLGRIKRQQNFYHALSNALKQPAVLVKLPDAIKIASKSIKTDMSFYELSQYALFAKSIDNSDIQAATLPGEPSETGIISYWIVDYDKTQALINSFIYREGKATPEDPIDVYIAYTASHETEAMSAKVQLEEMGAVVKMFEKDKLASEQITVNNLKLSSSIIKNYKRHIPELKNKQIVYDNFENSSRDYTIFFGN